MLIDRSPRRRDSLDGSRKRFKGRHKCGFLVLDVQLFSCTAQLGLHRDGAAFGLAEHEVVERRKSFYELVIQERLQALCFAR
jgi:hypothetical protein